MRRSVSALFLAVLLGSPAFAQSPAPSTSVPRVVRLDGQLAPANGQAPAAVETVTLSIYATQTDGMPLWTETQDVRVDAQGRYAVFLGASTAEGIPASVLSGEARWLGIRFARVGEVEQPRVPMTAVPYALRASDADTLGGLPPSAFFRVPDATATSGASGTATSADRTIAPLVSTGTANYIGKFTNSVDLTNSVLFENAGRIGLGTTAPLDLLHSRFTDTSGGLTGIAVQNLGSSATSYSGMLFYDQNGALGQFQGFNNSTHEYRINNIASGGTINFMLGGSSRFQVRNDGDIDISGSIRKAGTLLLHARGLRNIGVGRLALGASTDAQSSLDNVAIGENAMESLTTGAGGNNAVGRRALRSITSGVGNNAMGYVALRDAVGSFNIAIGDFAATTKVTGDNNLYLGNSVGDSAVNTESSTVRIADTINYNRFFVGAVRGVTTGLSNAVAVVIDSNGQLGTVNSSRRYKEDIQDMGEASSRLMQLRPVTYRYTQAYADGSKPIDYGLIAEEVEQVYPDLVAHLKDGEVETVQYHKINAMLLNEVQKQHRQIGEQLSLIEGLTARLAALEKLLIEKR